MKVLISFKTAFIAAFAATCCFSTVFITSCQKDECESVYCQNGGTCSSGYCTCASGYTGLRCENKTKVTVTYKNNTPTTVGMSINGTAISLSPGATYSITGEAGSAITGAASTSSNFGLEIVWDLRSIFPSTDKMEPLDIPTSYFFLKFKNISSETITSLYVNYGLVSETHEYPVIPDNGVVYSIGYYKAFPNSNVRAVSVWASVWYWNPISVSSNREVVLTATD